MITTRVNARLIDGAGKPIVGATIVASLTRVELDHGVVVPRKVSFVTDGAGMASMNLWPNSRGTGESRYRIEAFSKSDSRPLMNVFANVPESGETLDLHTLVSTDAPPSLSQAEVILNQANQAIQTAKAASVEATNEADRAEQAASEALAAVEGVQDLIDALGESAGHVHANLSVLAGFDTDPQGTLTWQGQLVNKQAESIELSDVAPSNLGATASAGSGDKAAREDHVHPLPTATQVGAEVAGAVAWHVGQANPHPQYAQALEAHAAERNPHGATAADVGADPAGTAAGLVTAHGAESNPHPQYARSADVADALSGKAGVDHGHEVGHVAGLAEGLLAISNSVLEMENAIGTKQNVLVSGTNIKTINGQPILGSGDVQITPWDGQSLLSNAAPQPLGTATPGSATTVSRSDHVHAVPSPAQVGAEPAGAVSAHVAAANPHSQYVLGENLAPLLSGKANVVHGHAISDVTGMQAALDGKAASAHTHTIANVSGLQAELDAKQNALVSGTNIKTINGQPVLGSGNIEIVASGGEGAALSNSAPLALGVASAGTAATASRSDHVHPLPGAAQVGADPAGTASASMAAHTGASDPHTQYVQKVAGKQLSTEDFTSAEKTKLAGVAAGAQVNVATNLGISGSGNTRSITSSTGSSVSVPTATSSNAGFMSTGDKAKLDAIAAGATANSTDAHLLNRNNHTGSQAISTVTGLQAALDEKAASTHSHTPAETGADPAGTASASMAAHTGAADPHPQYSLKASLAQVASSGNYLDLSNRPTLGTAAAAAVGDFATAAQGAKADAAHGWGNHATAGYQSALVSGTNIKTINGQSVLGPGNIAIDGGSSLPAGGSLMSMLIFGPDGAAWSSTITPTLLGQPEHNLGNLGAAITLDPSLGNRQTGLVNANVTITMPPPVDGGVIFVRLRLINSGGTRAITISGASRIGPVPDLTDADGGVNFLFFEGNPSGWYFSGEKAE
ncbi:phage tail repeat domain-containing protein [Ectothiorhodospira shaposhnikovii]|uniref:phage tail repeat domain-containing protein n=1 Tax=Ectothiorhodospira shaposhnikovii TaxID=1054 RepID=UPI001EE8A8EE|nr:phage tail repeat domain-containing protein [Ectothiorhodospira shaposhnikovii]MCG5512872.1 hypothetical protein [Ectothiorhodospira shaposhnikovii]